MTIDTTERETKRPKMAPWEKDARRKQAAHNKSRSASSASNWDPWPLEKHLEKGQLDMVVNGALPLPPSPKPGSNLPITRDVHDPISQLDRFVSGLEQTGVINPQAFERMAEILSVIHRGDRDPTWGESRRMFERMCLAVARAEPEAPGESEGYGPGSDDDDDDDDGGDEPPAPEPPASVGPMTWQPQTAEEAAAAGQGDMF